MAKLMRWCRMFAAMPLVALCLPAAVAQQEPLTVPEALQLRNVSNPLLGDDFVAFQRVVPRPLEDGPGGSYLHLGVIDRLSAGNLTVRWLVDGKQSSSRVALRPGTREVSFVVRTPQGSQLVVQSIDGGKPTLVEATPSIRSYKWRPDGQAFAFTSLEERSVQQQHAHDRGFRPVVVDEDWRHLSLWECEIGVGARRLTQDTTVYDFQYAPDGASIAAACAPRNLTDDSYMFKRLHVIDVASGQRTKLVDNPGKLGDFAFSPDGATVFYISAADRNDPHAGMLYSVGVDDGEVEAHTHGFTGMVQHLHASGTGVLVQEAIGTRTRLRHLDASGKQSWAFEPKEQQLAITGFSSRGDAFVFSASHAEHPAELFLPEPVSGPGTASRLTTSNPGLENHAFGEQQVVRIRTRDGLQVEGVLILPIGYQQGTRYPLVIVAHGGPESHYQNGWLTTYSQWGQLLAAQGVVSWYPNYRSSTGYGVAFCKHDHGDPMGKEFEDHLDAIAHFDKQGLIDKDRVGVGGGSYGGYTAAWAATRHSEHFAAAVSFVPFTDIRTKWLTTDISWEFYYVHYQEKWPWQQPGLLADRSPLSWASHCKTPLLLLGGDSDPRVHPSQPFMLYRAVKFATKTPTRYIQYPGEGHGNRSNVNRYDYCLRTLRWFEHYLLGDGDRRSKQRPPIDVDYPQ